MVALIQMEWLKLIKRPLTWGLLTVQIAILFLGNFANSLSLDTTAPEQYAYLLRGLLLPDSLAMTAQFIYQFGAILLATLSAAAIGSEYGWGTLRQMMATGLSRARFLIAKFVALAAVAVGFVIIPLLMSLLILFWVSQTQQQPLFLGDLQVGWLIALIGRTYLIVVMPMALAFLIALIARSQMVGVSATVIVLVIDQIGAPILWKMGFDWSLQLVHFFPFWCARTLLGENFTSLPQTIPDLTSPERALITLVVYTLLCGLTAIWVFRHRDIGGAV